MNIKSGMIIRRYNEQNLALFYAALPLGVDVDMQTAAKGFDR